jgi:hypothetical protein
LIQKQIDRRKRYNIALNHQSPCVTSPCYRYRAPSLEASTSRKHIYTQSKMYHSSSFSFSSDISPTVFISDIAAVSHVSRPTRRRTTSSPSCLRTTAPTHIARAQPSPSRRNSSKKRVARSLFSPPSRGDMEAFFSDYQQARQVRPGWTDRDQWTTCPSWHE